ncbi:MAG: glucosyltransferase domain-containing protein [Lachnospiraceae bacterium]|nr:glucosyltransferase domain-containing protein [Lachnospiraceae bacterium]
MNEQKRFTVKREYLVILAATFSFAIVAHGSAMFQKFSILDDPVYLFDVGATYTSGRWMLYLLYRFTRFAGYSAYSLPIFNSLVSFFFLAVVSCILTELFSIRRTGSLIAVSGMLTVTPAVTGLMAYHYTMPYYFFGLLLSVAGAALAAKRKKLLPSVAGIVLIACGIGIYQAYLPFAMGVFLVYCILQIADGKDSGIREILYTALRLVAVALAALLLYLMVNAAVLSFVQDQMTDYRSLDTFGRTTAAGYLARIGDAFVQFFVPDAGASYNMYPLRTTWLFYLTVVLVALAAYLHAKRLLQQNKADGICFILFLLLSPFVFNFIFVITGKEEVHTLMVHAQVLFIFLAASLMERLPADREESISSGSGFSSRKRSVSLRMVWIAAALMLCTGLTRYAEICYQGTHYAQAEALKYLNRLALKIEQTPGYREDTVVAYVGEYEKKADTLPSYDAFHAIVTFPYPRNVEELLNQYTWKLMMEQWCGFLPPLTDPAPFAEKEQVKSMPCYPDDGSIAVIDDVIVVKFADAE